MSAAAVRLMIVRRMAVAEVAVAAGCRKLECTVEMIIGHDAMYIVHLPQYN